MPPRHPGTSTLWVVVSTLLIFASPSMSQTQANPRQLAEIRDELADKDWRGALKLYKALFERAEEDPALQAQLRLQASDIRDDYRWARFWKDHGGELLANILSGNVTHSNRRPTFELSYNVDQLKELFGMPPSGKLELPHPSDAPPETGAIVVFLKRPRGHDGEWEGTPLPLVFTDSYSLRIEGVTTDLNDRPQVQFGTQSHYYIIDCDWANHFGSLSRCLNGACARLKNLYGRKTTSLWYTDPYEIQVNVDRKHLKLSVDGNQVQKGKKSPDVFGQIGFDQLSLVHRVELKGKVSLEWEAMVREAQARQVLATTVDYENELPDWLVVALNDTPEDEPEDLGRLSLEPDEEFEASTSEDVTMHDRVEAAWGTGKLMELLPKELEDQRPFWLAVSELLAACDQDPACLNEWHRAWDTEAIYQPYTAFVFGLLQERELRHLDLALLDQMAHLEQGVSSKTAVDALRQQACMLIHALNIADQQAAGDALRSRTKKSLDTLVKRCREM